MKNKTIQLIFMLLCFHLFFLNFNSAFAQIIYWNGTVNYNTNTTINDGYINITGNTTVVVAAGVTVTVSVVLNGNPAWTFTKAGAGTLILTGNNTAYTCATIIADGTLSASVQSIVNTPYVNLTSSSTTLSIGGGGTFSKVISGTGNIRTSGELILTGNNTYTGTTTVYSGRLQIGNGTSTTANIDSTSQVILNSTSAPFGIIKFMPGEATTFSKAISGKGNVEYQGSAIKTLTLTEPNTYSGSMTIVDGTLILGANGTIDSSSVHLNSSTAKLDISAGNKTFKELWSTNTASNAEVILGTRMLTIYNANTCGFYGMITGTGGVTKNGIGIFALHGNNTYTGTTIINQGDLRILGTIGTIMGNIVNDATLSFGRSNAYTYSGSISGTGDVCVMGSSQTFSGIHTYSGETRLSGNSTLILTATGSIENSSVVLEARSFLTTKFDISAGNKTIKGLRTTDFVSSSNSGVILGSSTLTIGTTGQNDGGGTYHGIFTGTGGVTKTGTAIFRMSTNPNNTATGIFTHSEGTVFLNNKWVGNYYMSAAATLQVWGNATVGSLTLTGGNINMNTNTSPLSKLTVIGAVIASGTNTLNITTSSTQSNYILIQAGSGITSLSPYVLAPVSGFPYATLNVNSPTQLRFNAPAFVAVTDITGIPTTATATLPLTLSGTVVPNNATNKTITWSVLNAGTTGATISGTNTLNTINSGTVTVLATIANGASPTTNFTKQFTITVNKTTLGGTISITGNTVFGQTLTVNTSGLTSTPTIPNLGTLSYQWKRGTTNIGINSATYTLVQADIDNTITVTVTAVNCDGSKTSTPTATVTKATQIAPAAPTLASKTETSITLNAVTGCEYNSDGGNWQTSTTFSGLTPNTSYSFRQRKAETATHLASPESSAASFKTDDEVGVDENEQGNITIYPNPTTGELIIDNGELTINSVEVFDVFGRKLKGKGGKEQGGGKIQLDISDLSAGIYFVKIRTETGEVVKKVVKE